MLRFIKPVRIIFLGVILLFLSIHNSFGQIQSKNILNQEVSLNITCENLFQVSASLSALEGISVGFEGAADFDINKRDGNIEIKSGTLKDVLDSIIKQEPDYEWEVKDGVVNFYPVRSRDHLIKALLGTKIKSFVSKGELGRQDISNVIERSEEVNTLLNSKQTALKISTKTNLYKADDTTDIDVSNIDLKSVLNKIVKNSDDSKLWIIVRPSNSDKELLIMF